MNDDPRQLAALRRRDLEEWQFRQKELEDLQAPEELIEAERRNYDSINQARQIAGIEKIGEVWERAKAMRAEGDKRPDGELILEAAERIAGIYEPGDGELAAALSIGSEEEAAAAILHLRPHLTPERATMLARNLQIGDADARSAAFDEVMGGENYDAQESDYAAAIAQIAKAREGRLVPQEDPYATR